MSENGGPEECVVARERESHKGGNGGHGKNTKDVKVVVGQRKDVAVGEEVVVKLALAEGEDMALGGFGQDLVEMPCKKHYLGHGLYSPSSVSLAGNGGMTGDASLSVSYTSSLAPSNIVAFFVDLRFGSGTSFFFLSVSSSDPTVSSFLTYSSP